MAEEKKLSFKEIKEFYKERKLDPLHTNSSYHCLDGSKLTTDVGYFDECMENGFLVDLELFMTGRITSGGSGGVDHCAIMLFLHLNALENAVNAKNQYVMQVAGAGTVVVLMTSKPIWLTCLTFETV